MSSLQLHVESGWGGTFEECASDLLELAKKLDLCVTTKANGVMMFAWPHETVDVIVKRYENMRARL
jgi:hypothetical protein